MKPRGAASATVLGPIRVSVGAAVSSFVMVPVPVAVAIVASVGADNVTVNVSSASYSVSPTTGTVIVPVVAPTAIVRVPLVVV